MSTALLGERTSRHDGLRPVRHLLEAYARRRPVSRIAIVGNAPLQPSRARAERIDSADLVIRCNSFVLDEPGAEPCLGRRVEAVVIARATLPSPYVFHRYRERAYLIPDVGNSYKRRPEPVPASWPKDLGCLPIPNDVLGVPLFEYLGQRVGDRGVVPTTGTQAVFVARRVFPDAGVTLAGFSFIDERRQTRWKHHYGSDVPVHPAHPIDREGALLQSWIDDGPVQVAP